MSCIIPPMYRKCVCLCLIAADNEIPSSSHQLCDSQLQKCLFGQVPADAVIAVPSAREVQDHDDNQRAMSDRQAGTGHPQQGQLAVLHQISPYIRFQVSCGLLVHRIPQHHHKADHMSSENIPEFGAVFYAFIDCL